MNVLKKMLGATDVLSGSVVEWEEKKNKGGQYTLNSPIKC